MGAATYSDMRQGEDAVPSSDMLSRKEEVSDSDLLPSEDADRSGSSGDDYDDDSSKDENARDSSRIQHDSPVLGMAGADLGVSNLGDRDNISFEGSSGDEYDLRDRLFGNEHDDNCNISSADRLIESTLSLTVCNLAGHVLWHSDAFDVNTSFRDLRDMVGEAASWPGECSTLVHDTGQLDPNSSLKILGLHDAEKDLVLTFVKDGETEEITVSRPPSGPCDVDAEQEVTTYCSGKYHLLQNSTVRSSHLGSSKGLMQLRKGSTIRILAFAKDDFKAVICGFIHEPVHGWIEVADAVLHKCWARLLEDDTECEVKYEVLGGEDAPGFYEILDDVIVTSDKCLESRDITELKEGTKVHVLETAELQDVMRVRGRIEKPRGWISLRDTSSGRCWACKDLDISRN